MLQTVRTLTLSESIDIDAPIDAVRLAFDDLDRWPEWNTVCMESRWTSEAPWEIGSSFFMRLRMATRPVPFNVTVTEFDPLGTVEWESSVMTITGTRRFNFESLSDGAATRVTDSKWFRSSVLPVRLFYPRPIIQAMSRGWLASLRRCAESAVSGRD